MKDDVDHLEFWLLELEKYEKRIVYSSAKIKFYNARIKENKKKGGLK